MRHLPVWCLATQFSCRDVSNTPGGATTSGDVMATDVGAGFRPAREVNLPASQQGGAAASISIATNGNIIIRRTTTQTWTSLDNISYRKAL